MIEGNNRGKERFYLQGVRLYITVENAKFKQMLPWTLEVKYTKSSWQRLDEKCMLGYCPKVILCTTGYCLLLWV